MAKWIVETKYGKLKGRISYDYKGGEYYSFQGIPYAKPPLGELRFKGPLPPEKWEGIRDATKLGNECLSCDFVDKNKVVGTEDCLYLNVYTPGIQDKSPLLPVMFWIHGGGFNCGSGSTVFFGPEYLITQNVVLVTINYRLGILGFLSLEDTSLGVPGNAGLKDIVQALKWVQANIENFGGDPTNVTVFGESAGGAAIHLMMCSPIAEGLFHRGIIQSGSAFNPWVYSSRISKELCEILNIKSKKEKDLLEYLRKVPSEEFINIQSTVKKKLVKSTECDETRPFRVVIEKVSTTEPNFLTQNPWDIIESGHYYKIPLIIGYAKDEGFLTDLRDIREYGSLRIPTDLTTRIPYYYNVPKESDLSKNIVQKIEEFYFDNKELSSDVEEGFLKLETDVLFYRGVFVAMRQLLTNLNLPIHMYRFSADTQLNIVKKFGKIKRPGTCHCDIIGYLFTTAYTPSFDANSLEATLIQKLISMWTNFAKTSNPNSDSTQITWKPVSDDCYHYLDIGNELIARKDPEIERMKFWDEISSDPEIKSNF